MFWLAEDGGGAAQSAAPRSGQSGVDFHLRLRRLQSGAHAKSGGRSSGGVSRGRSVSAGSEIAGKAPREDALSTPQPQSTMKKARTTPYPSIFQQPARKGTSPTGAVQSPKMGSAVQRLRGTSRLSKGPLRQDNLEPLLLLPRLSAIHADPRFFAAGGNCNFCGG